MLLRIEHDLIRFIKISLVLTVAFLVTSFKTAACPLQLPTSIISIKSYTLIVEIARTPASRNCGLSNRFELPENQGMLFVYPDLRHRTYWMKDTYFPLSIAFLDESGRINDLQKMSDVQSKTRYYSSEPAKYALEVNLGWYDDHGIGIGDVVDMDLLTEINLQ